MARFVAKVIANIKLLRPLYEDQPEPPPDLVKVVQNITAELIKYLRSHPRELYNLRPRQFEELIAEILASYGYQVRITRATRDGGYDIYAIEKSAAGLETSWIIECKKYAENRTVGIDVVRALYGTKIKLGVANMLLATTSRFSAGVKAYKASTYDFALRDYEDILEWLNEYKPNPRGKLYIKDNKLKLPAEE